jgi:hypothetical protein
MQARAIAMARWLLPVPVPSMSALPRNERPSGQISNERSIDWRAGEVEVVEVFGERQLCRRELVFDRARLLLGLR